MTLFDNFTDVFSSKPIFYIFTKVVLFSVSILAPFPHFQTTDRLAVQKNCKTSDTVRKGGQSVNKILCKSVSQSVTLLSSWLTQGSPWGHPGSPRGHGWSLWGHPRPPMGHPGVILGHPGVILGHPGVILSSKDHPGSSRGHPGSLWGHPGSS